MRVVEVFGPTIQGEGPLAGRVTHFLRLGGCDYRCAWCDSMHAVEPELVRHADDLSEPEIIDRLGELRPAPMIVLSGGNPALWRLGRLMEMLRQEYELIAVETQGSVWREWLANVDSLVISPKPPSSGMTSLAHEHQFERFMKSAACNFGRVLKIVVFDQPDLDWALSVHLDHPDVPLWLSCGTAPTDIPAELGDRYGWLCEQVVAEPWLHDVAVLPQLHVIAWGHRVGV